MTLFGINKYLLLEKISGGTTNHENNFSIGFCFEISIGTKYIPIFISFSHFTAICLVKRKTLNMKIENASHQMKNHIGQSYGMKNAKSLFYLPLKLNFLKRYYTG